MPLLIADDHDLVRETLAAFLLAEGFDRVETAADLAGALAAMRGAAFDLVLLDYSMPGMDGLAGLAQAIAVAGGRPVALISGTTARDLAEAALRAGAAGFVPKTLGSGAIAAAIRHMAAGEVFAPIGLLSEPPGGAGGPVQPDPARDGCAAWDLSGPVEQGNRPHAGCAGGDGEAACQDAVAQAGRAQPHACRDDRTAGGAGLAGRGTVTRRSCPDLRQMKRPDRFGRYYYRLTWRGGGTVVPPIRVRYARSRGCQTVCR